MNKNEVIEMLETLATMAEPIQTPETKCGYGTLLSEITFDSFLYVLNSTLEILRDGDLCENCTYRLFGDKVGNIIVDKMTELGIDSVEELAELLGGES